MRAATYVLEHMALSMPSQASQQMCQGRFPLLGFQCDCRCRAGGEQRHFVNIWDLAFPMKTEVILESLGEEMGTRQGWGS